MAASGGWARAKPLWEAITQSGKQDETVLAFLASTAAVVGLRGPLQPDVAGVPMLKMKCLELQTTPLATSAVSTMHANHVAQRHPDCIHAPVPAPPLASWNLWMERRSPVRRAQSQPQLLSSAIRRTVHHGSPVNCFFFPSASSVPLFPHAPMPTTLFFCFLPMVLY